MGFNDSRQGGFGNRFNNGPVEKHKAICAECKKDCEVPFKPIAGRPVYCQECYAKNRPKR